MIDYFRHLYTLLKVRYFEWKLRKVYKEDTYVYEEDQNFDAKD